MTAVSAFDVEAVFPPGVTYVIQAASRNGIVYVGGVRNGNRGYLARMDSATGAVTDLSQSLPETAMPWALAAGNAGSFYVAGTAGGFAFAQKYGPDGRPQYTVSFQQESAQASRAISIVTNDLGEALIGGEVWYRVSAESLICASYCTSSSILNNFAIRSRTHRRELPGSS